MGNTEYSIQGLRSVSQIIDIQIGRSRLEYSRWKFLQTPFIGNIPTASHFVLQLHVALILLLNIVESEDISITRRSSRRRVKYCFLQS